MSVGECSVRVCEGKRSAHYLTRDLSLYQPMTAKAVMSSHKPITIIDVGALILGIIL